MLSPNNPKISGLRLITLFHIGWGLVSLRQEPKAIVVIVWLPTQYKVESKNKIEQIIFTLSKYLNKLLGIITLCEV